MLWNNNFPNSETKIKKNAPGVARDLSESFGIFEIVRVFPLAIPFTRIEKIPDFWEILSLETISKMLRNNHFPNSETKIKKNVPGEARDLSESFGIFEIVRVVLSQSHLRELKKSAFSGPEKEDLIGYRYKPFKDKCQKPIAIEFLLN